MGYRQFIDIYDALYIPFDAAIWVAACRGLLTGSPKMRANHLSAIAGPGE
jgi:hypothetical protein